MLVIVVMVLRSESPQKPQMGHVATQKLHDTLCSVRVSVEWSMSRLDMLAFMSLYDRSVSATATRPAAGVTLARGAGFPCCQLAGQC